MAKQAEPISLISRLTDRFTNQAELPLMLPCLKSNILARHCISSIGRKGSASKQNNKQNAIPSHTTGKTHHFLSGSAGRAGGRHKGTAKKRRKN